MMENDDNIEQAQSPSARAGHHRGQNAAAAPEKPAAMAQSAGSSLTTSGITIVSSFFCLPTTPPLLHLRLECRKQR